MFSFEPLNVLCNRQTLARAFLHKFPVLLDIPELNQGARTCVVPWSVLLTSLMGAFTRLEWF